jgi:2-dehydro-3-deoxy-D-arabinonate dehydratase
MPVGVFRVQLPDGSRRLARGDSHGRPTDLLPEELSIDGLLSERSDALRRAASEPSSGDVPRGARIVAPVESQEVWAAGVTYFRSREARREEAAEPSAYDLVYDAQRPELFFKSPGWRVRGPGEPIAVRSDSAWNVPEPELALVLDAAMDVAGYAVGDDVSSRSIEGENTLYLPQAKVYDGACAVGPCIVPAGEVDPPFTIALEVSRGANVAYRGVTTTELMRRSFGELCSYLGRALTFPVGAVLLTGTPLVPDPPFTLEPADLVSIEIEGLGRLDNPVVLVAAAAASPRTGVAPG